MAGKLRGLEALTDAASGELLQRVPLDCLLVPASVRLSNGVFEFDWSANISTPEPSSRMLEDFLAAGSDRALLSFARRFGPLGLQQVAAIWLPRPRTPVELGRLGTQREPLTVWQSYRAEFLGLLSLLAAVRTGDPMTAEMLSPLCWQGIQPEPIGSLGELLQGKIGSLLDAWPNLKTLERREAGIRLVSNRLHSFALQCAIRPALQFGSVGTASLLFQDGAANWYGRAGVGISTFGALVVQLLATAAGTKFSICTNCGNVFTPRRRPVSSRRKYCFRPDCKRAAVRDAGADYRKRLRGTSRIERS